MLQSYNNTGIRPILVKYLFSILATTFFRKIVWQELATSNEVLCDDLFNARTYLFFISSCRQYFCSLSGKELMCWTGHDTAMSKKSCSAAPSPAPTGQTARESSLNEKKTFCYYLMYQNVNSTDSTLSFEKNPISARLSHINASCDVQGLCNSSIVRKPVQVWNLLIMLHVIRISQFFDKLLYIITQGIFISITMSTVCWNSQFFKLFWI